MNYDIDWESDRWFTMNHAANLTPEFKVWWLDYYGYPREYDKSQGGLDEYWTRCAFALMGWNASAEANPAPRTPPD